MSGHIVVFADVSLKTASAVAVLRSAANAERSRAEYWAKCEAHWASLGDAYSETCKEQRAACERLAAQYEKWAKMFDVGTPPERPDVGERPSWFPPYQEGTIWITNKYPNGIPTEISMLVRAWNAYV